MGICAAFHGVHPEAVEEGMHCSGSVGAVPHDFFVRKTNPTS